MTSNKFELSQKLKNAELFIFDMDGTILDREKLIFEVYSSVLKQYIDLELTIEDYKKFFLGIKSHNGFENYLSHKNILDYDIHQLINTTRSKMWERLQNETADVVKIKPHIKEFLEVLKNKNLKIALATSAKSKFVDFILRYFQIYNYFDLIVTAEDVEIGKPNPKIFLIPCEKLNISINKSIVFEDAENGVKAAKNAGIFCIGVCQRGWNEDFLNKADAIIENYQECIRLIK